MSGTGTNPLTVLGPLNRLRASVVFPLMPQLNITSSFLAKRAINISPSGDATAYLQAMVAAVPSPEPYQVITLTAYLVKSTPLANAWKLQQEINGLLGPLTVRPDTSALAPFQLFNTVMGGWEAMSFAGDEVDYPVKIMGTYYINSALFSS